MRQRKKAMLWCPVVRSHGEELFLRVRYLYM
jgi:hypothetical protein